MFCILKAIIAWIIMVVAGQTRVASVARGFLWTPPSFDAPTVRSGEVLRRECQRLRFANIAWILIDILIAVACLFALYHFWNIGLAVTAGLLMVFRLPDMLWKMRVKDKVWANKANLPKNVFSQVCCLLSLLTLPVTWYCRCRWAP